MKKPFSSEWGSEETFSDWDSVETLKFWGGVMRKPSSSGVEKVKKPLRSGVKDSEEYIQRKMGK